MSPWPGIDKTEGGILINTLHYNCQGRSQNFSRGGVQFVEIFLTTPTSTTPTKSHSFQQLGCFYNYCSLQIKELGNSRYVLNDIG